MFTIICSKFECSKQLVKFLFTVELSSDFCKVQISAHYEEIIHKFVVLSFAFARPSTSLREIKV
jgi:hypothetical protein